MTYISIDAKTRQAKKIVELIETIPFAKVLKDPNNITKKAISDAKKSRTRSHTNAKALVAYLNR